VRYKGNSSLNSGWSSGSDKLPFKFDFDEFEDEYPEIENQRFYGFKQLSLANGFGDDTFMREAMAYDLLEAAGLVAAETAFYNVTLDYGAGPVNLGLYVVVEVIDDTVIERTFGDDSGNIYEGDGAAASLATGTLAQIPDSFQKENNADEADWSDLETLYNVLHSETRTSDAAAWRAELEAVFDVDSFLEWLGLSAVLLHWDTYGSMTHNYYLYHNPETDQLTWISWDHNQVLEGVGSPGGGPVGQGGGRPGGGGPNRSTSFDKTEVGENWPLIRYLLDDPVYYERYIGYLNEISTWYNPDAMAAQYQTWAALLEPFAAATGNPTAFPPAVQSLTITTYDRATALSDFLRTR
jgi:spore coat protein CotH